MPYIEIPDQEFQRFRGVKLVRMASIFAIVSFSLLMLPQLAGIFYESFLYDYGGYGIFFLLLLTPLLKLGAYLLLIAGSVILLIGITLIAKNSSENTSRFFVIAFIIQIIALIADITVEVLLLVNDFVDNPSDFNYMPIFFFLKAALYFGFFLAFSFATREFKKEAELEPKLLISPFIYIIVIAMHSVGMVFKFSMGFGVPRTHIFYTYFYYPPIITILFVYVVGTLEIILSILVFSELIKEYSPQKILPQQPSVQQTVEQQQVFLKKEPRRKE